MIKLLLSAAFAIAAFSQTLTLTGPASARPGSTVNLTVNTTAATAGGYQWGITFPAGYTATPAIAAPVAAAGKSLYCNPAGTICLMFGQTSAAAIAPGALATYSVQVPGTAAAGTVPLNVSNVLGASPSAAAVTITPGAAYSLVVLAKADVDGNGKVDLADVFALRDMVLNGAQCTADQNGDGVCDIKDVVLVLLAVLLP